MRGGRRLATRGRKRGSPRGRSGTHSAQASRAVAQSVSQTYQKAPGSISEVGEAWNSTLVCTWDH